MDGRTGEAITNLFDFKYLFVTDFNYELKVSQW